MKTIRVLVTALNLKFLIADILEEQRNPAFITSKKTYVHKANQTFKDPIHQSKGLKRTESSRSSNRYWRLDKGSNYNIFFKNDDNKVFKNVEIEFESDLNLELESFTYIIKNFDLNDNKSNYSISSLNFKNNIKDFETEDNY